MSVNLWALDVWRIQEESRTLLKKHKCNEAEQQADQAHSKTRMNLRLAFTFAASCDDTGGTLGCVRGQGDKSCIVCL